MNEIEFLFLAKYVHTINKIHKYLPSIYNTKLNVKH